MASTNHERAADYLILFLESVQTDSKVITSCSSDQKEVLNALLYQYMQAFYIMHVS